MPDMDPAILEMADLYAKGLAEVLERRQQWLLRYKQVKEYLKLVANHLNEHSLYPQKYYVDTNYAFNEEINGSCSQIPSLTFRSGEMPINIAFKNASGEKRDYIEEGFHLAFSPTITGHIMVMLRPHHSSFSGERPEYVNLALIDQPGSLTEQMIDEILKKALEAAFTSSYTGVSYAQQRDNQDAQRQRKYTPIGFKRTETTQKID